VKTSFLVLEAATLPGDTVTVPTPSAHVTISPGDGLSPMSDPCVVDCSKALKMAGPPEAGTVASA
jgi:hypothetical protein